MDIDTGSWKKLFGMWPDGMARRGVLVTAFGEQIPFSGFSAASAMLLLERQTPDSLGARMVIVSYDQIVALKITEVVKFSAFRSLGFE